MVMAHDAHTVGDTRTPMRLNWLADTYPYPTGCTHAALSPSSSPLAHSLEGVHPHKSTALCFGWHRQPCTQGGD